MNPSRTPGRLTIDDQARATLALFRLRRGITVAPVLDLDAVRAVEAEIGVPVHDAIWAWLAAAGRDPCQVLTLTADAREEQNLPRRLVAFERDGHDLVYYGVERSSSRLERCPVWEWDGHSAVQRWPDVASFVRSRHALAPGPLPGGLYESEIGRFEAELAAFTPALVAASSEPHLHRVWHPRFGDGVVLRELRGEPTKLDIDFGPSGRKVVLSSYVREIVDVAPSNRASEGRVAHVAEGLLPLPTQAWLAQTGATVPATRPRRPVRPAA